MSDAPKETFLLKWTKTWADRDDDFTGKDRQNPRTFARVYRISCPVDPDKAWFWTVSVGDRRVASGYTADADERARPAVRASEKAWKDYIERASSRGS